jgi:hypothetical protein
MDQVRTALAWLKKHHFWVLTGLAVLIALGCWWSAANKMSAKYEADQKTIKGGFDIVGAVKSASFHPNDTINNHEIDEIKKVSGGVAKLWQVLYDKQRENVLQWPTALNKAFRDAVEKMQFAEDIPRDLRDNYQNYIELHFPELPKQISARPIEGNEAGGPGGPGGEFRRTYVPESPGGANAGPDDNDYICEWLDQAVIRDELNFPQRPSSLRIWVTQEDLWVYHTLLDVIAKTNQAAGATRMSNAAVKTIYSLEVGSRAAPYSRKSGRLLVPPAVAGATDAGPGGMPGPGGPGGPPGGGPMGERPGMGPPGGGPMGERGMSGQGMGPGALGNGPMTPAMEQNFLLSGRYLDDKGQPIVLGGGGGAEAGTPAAPATAGDASAAGGTPSVDMNQFGTGFKRLPIRMVLQMDARWLPQLITTCANEPLRVEVQEVRINPPDGGSVGGIGGPAGFGGGGGPGMGGQPGANVFQEHAGILTFPAQPHIKNVVIQGIIYIFNKPNLNILAPPAEPTAATGN